MKLLNREDYKNIIANNTEYVTVNQALILFDCTRKTIYKYLKTGRIKHYRNQGIIMLHLRSTLEYLSSLNSADIFSNSEALEIQDYYGAALKRQPDRLTIREVMLLTGYQKTAVQQWINKGWLLAFKIRYEYIIPKCCFLNFVCSANYRTIRVKSSKHKNDLRQIKGGD